MELRQMILSLPKFLGCTDTGNQILLPMALHRTVRALRAGQLRYYLQYSLYPPHPFRVQLEWYCEVHVEKWCNCNTTFNLTNLIQIS